VRENGAEICCRRGAQNPGGPKVDGNEKSSALSVVIEIEDRSVYGSQSHDEGDHESVVSAGQCHRPR
jgi:hypothetical protein